MPGLRPITVIKRSLDGRELWRYEGFLTRREGNAIHLEARFNARDEEFMGVTIRKGDVFSETYFTDRWYNLYAIHDQEDGSLKGWYCNIGKPVVEEAEGVFSYVDLALDLWVAPDGTQTVLDEDEFAALDLDDETRSQALAALDDLKRQFPR